MKVAEQKTISVDQLLNCITTGESVTHTDGSGNCGKSFIKSQDSDLLVTGHLSLLIFLDQMIDVGAVGLGDRRAFDEKNIFGVKLGAPGKII